MISLSTMMSAQKLKTYEGKFPKMKGEKALLVEFDYSDMSVGKFDKEADYVTKKVNEKNDDEAGSGDAWSKAWVNDREKRFEGKFFELFNKYAEKKMLKASKTTDNANYKLLLKTVHTEPGFNVGVVRRPAHCNFEVWLYKIGENNPVAKARLKKVLGQDAMGFDFDTGQRLAESYAKAGKIIGKYFEKDLLK